MEEFGLRVVGGEKRGLKLREMPKDATCRPTLDRVKVAMFDIVRFELSGKALDLFSGTGQIGIEAISNGCEKAVFCDKDPVSLRITRENIKKAGFEDRAEILDCDYKHFLRHRAKKDEFKVIFLDPPYETPLLEKSLAYISDAECLTEDGVIVAETLREKEMPEEVGNLIKTKSYAYGQVALHIYRRKEENI